MSEEIKTAQETVDTDIKPVDNGVEGDADLNKAEDVNDFEFTDSDTSSEEKPKATEEEPKNEETKKEPQTKEQNSENARRRREEERQKELKLAKEQAIIETLGGENPYTHEPMVDSVDVEEYLTMREIEKSGGDPLGDYSKFTKKKQKQEIESQSQKQKQEDWIVKDREDFYAKHPEVDVDRLVKDESFRKFADGKIGVQPMAKIYEDFAAIVSEYEKKSKQYAQKIVANAKASPGSLHSPTPTENGFYTREQVQKMTQEEVSKNYDKIRASMTKWK
jgi:hypothetical protein